MSKLTQARCYLAGAMDRVKDGGVGWRLDIQSTLDDLGIHWLDPCRKPIDIGLEDEESRRLRHAAKMRGDFDYVAKEMRTIRCVDLRMTDVADIVILNLDIDVHACGTYEELFWTNRQKKPILVHVEQGKQNAPDWLFGTIPHQHIFSTWDELADYVRRVASGEVDETFGRWYFFDWMGEPARSP